MEGNITERKHLPTFLENNLSPLEHKMIGSTPEMPLTTDSVETLMDKAIAGDAQARRLLLTPIFLQNKQRTLEQVQQSRAQERHERGNVGTFMFDPRITFELSMNNIDLYVEPSEIDPQTGEIKPEWRVYLVDNNNELVPDRSSFGKLKLDESMQKYFSFTVAPDQEYGSLRFRSKTDETI